jgi:hypothetical protein
MRAALCISGLPREFKRSYPSIKKYILDLVETDIFIYTWDAIKQPYFDIEGAIRYPDEGPLREYYDLYKPVAYHAERWDETVEKSFYKEKYEENRHPHASIVRYQAMLYTIYQCNELKNEYERIHGVKYDVVIKGRSDFELLRPMNLEELKEASSNRILYTDVLRPDGMVSDILWFGNKEVIDIACNLWKEFDGYHSKGVQFNTEILFPHHLKNHNISPRQHSIGGVSVLRPPQVVW